MSTISENEAFWAKELEKLKSSGLPRSQYCRENGVNYDRFGYWIKRLSAASPIFIPVKVQEKAPVTSSLVSLCTVELRDCVLKIHDLSALSFILERLT